MIPRYRLATVRRQMREAQLADAVACAIERGQDIGSQDFVQGRRVLDDPDPPKRGAAMLTLGGD